jgi:hypothetical protein
MPIATRDILATWYRPDGTLAIDEPIQYRLIPGSYAAGGMVPTGIVEDISNDVGQTNTALWVNGEGLTPTRWIVTNPSGEEYRFVVPPGDGALLLEELLEQEAHYPWRDFWSEDQADLIEASIMAKLADTIDAAMGDALVGVRNEHTGGAGRTAHEKFAEYVSLLDFDVDPTGVTDCRAGIQAAFDAIGNDPQNRTLYIPAGTYNTNSKVGVTPAITSLSLINKHHLRIVGDRGAVLTTGALHVQDNLAHGRFLIIRDCTDITLEGFTMRDISQDDPATTTIDEERRAGVAINIENSSQITIRDLVIDDFGSYGVGITEATNTFAVISSSISFAGHTITGTTGMFTGVVAPCTILIINSAYNDAQLHCTAVGPGATTLTVTEDLVTEAAGSSNEVLTNNSFSMNGQRLSVVTADLGFLNPGSRFSLAGTANGNDGIWTVKEVDEVEGLFLQVIDGQTFTTEGPGANVTMTKIANTNLSVLDAKACDDITVEHCLIKNCGRHGIEDFPKALSRNHRFLYNTIEDCGLEIPSGSAMKPGQSTIDTLVQGNVIRHCNMGMNPGSYAGIRVIGNTILNCEQYGIAIGLSTHVRGIPPQDNTLMVEIHNNLVAYTIDQKTGRLYSTPKPGNGAMNINGLLESIGLLDIQGNTFFRWGHSAGVYGNLGINFNKSYVPMPNIKIRKNMLIDCGGIRVTTLFYTCTMNGTATLSNFVNTSTGKTGPGGIYETMQLVGPNIPQEARVKSMNFATGEVVLTVPTTGSGSAVAVRSARPFGMVVEENVFESSNPKGAGVVQVASDGGIVRNNIIRGFVGNGLQALGSTFTIDGNRIIEPNRLGLLGEAGSDATLAPIFLGTNGDTGSYIVINNQVDLGRNGITPYMVMALTANIGSWYMYNNTSPQVSVLQYSGGTKAPVTPFWWEGNRLITTGTAAPTTGAWSSGYEIQNQVPTRFSALRGWLTVQSGNFGVTTDPKFISYGSIGGGTGPERAAITGLTASERFFYINTTTNTLDLWTGTAWKTVCSLA